MQYLFVKKNSFVSALFLSTGSKVAPIGSWVGLRFNCLVGRVELGPVSDGLGWVAKNGPMSTSELNVDDWRRKRPFYCNTSNILETRKFND